MQLNMVTRSRFQISGWFAALFAVALTTLTGCSPKTEPAKPAAAVSPAAVTNDDSDLLLRVRFAGTAQLMADTNAPYLTNLAALSETAALGRRLVERFASLPGRLLAPGSTNDVLATNLAPIFDDLLKHGFALELRGDSNGVQTMILAAPASALAPDPLQAAVMGFTNVPNTVNSSDGWTTWTVGAAAPSASLSALRSPSLPAPPLLAVQMASTLLPNPVRESVYGGFDRFSFTAVLTQHGFKIRGQATYARDLPALSGPVTVPTNLVTEPVISFSMVRNPLSWLSPGNPLRNFLPEPFPDIAWFWGGESSPYQLFMAIPLADTNRFAAEIGPGLAEKLSPVATASATGPVMFDAEAGEVQWALVPFLSPRVVMQPSGTNAYLVARTFPPADMGSGVTSPLFNRTSGTTNVVLFDWEFTQARMDAWSCLSQLALHLASHQQLDASNISWQWLRAAQKVLPGGGNMFTLLTQTSQRELSLDRLAPVGFTSLELYWLANWLESENFPAANFLAPGPSPFPTYAPTGDQQ